MLRLARNSLAKQCSVPRTRILSNRRQCRSKSTITPIEKIVLDSIKATGPISFATYMRLCLSHPIHGYYMNPINAVFGTRGDFITSPEISQVFGELVAVWLLSQWMNSGQTSGFRLVELGPGRGTLMEDVLRVISQFPSAQSSLRQVHLVETSDHMRSVQRQKLLPLLQTDKWDLFWHDSIDDVPRVPGLFTLLLAHEFFDALPVHLLEKTHQGWHEVFISSTERPISIPRDASTEFSTQQNFYLHLAPSRTLTSALLGSSSPRFQKLPIGARIEISPAAFKISRQVGELLVGNGSDSSGGAALIVDYGGEKAFGNSLRAFKDHKIVDIFHRPGECDLTTNVDFAYLKESLAGLARTHGIINQADFLERMGFALRVDALTRAAPSRERKEAIANAAQRLVDRNGMGREYQFLGITAGGNGSSLAEDGTVWPFVKDQE